MTENNINSSFFDRGCSDGRAKKAAGDGVMAMRYPFLSLFPWSKPLTDILDQRDKETIASVIARTSATPADAYTLASVAVNA
jgi:hypothetical protein